MLCADHNGYKEKRMQEEKKVRDSDVVHIRFPMDILTKMRSDARNLGVNFPTFLRIFVQEAYKEGFKIAFKRVS